jgi:hypothetical protein
MRDRFCGMEVTMRLLHVSLAALIFSLPSLARSQEPAPSQEPVWVLIEEGGAQIARYAPEGGPPLISVGCDSGTGEIVIFRAVVKPADVAVLTLATETGQMRLEAAPDPQGTPGVISRAKADNPFIAALPAAATVTFRISGEDDAQGGIAVPMSDPLRRVVEICAR